MLDGEPSDKALTRFFVLVWMFVALLFSGTLAGIIYLVLKIGRKLWSLYGG